MKWATTLIKAGRPIGKHFSLKDGQPKKTTMGHLVSGTYQVVEGETVTGFRDFLLSVLTDEVITQAVPRDGSEAGRITTKDGKSRGVRGIVRGKDGFKFPEGRPAWLTLDYDPDTGKPVRTPDELWAVVRKVWLGVEQGSVLWWCSSSSHIFDANGVERIGLGGQRLYVLIRDGGDIGRAGDVLMKRLWLEGFGRIHVNKGGAMEKRATFDAAMFRVSNLDYIGGAVCADGLEQRRPEPKILGEGSPRDTLHDLPDLTPEEWQRYEAEVARKKAGALPEAVAVKEAHIREEVTREMSTGSASNYEDTERRVRERVEAAAKGVLTGDHPLEVLRKDGSGFDVVTVAEALDQWEMFNGRKCKPPMNPEHRGGSPDAVLYLNQAQPICWDLDSRVSFKLVRCLSRVVAGGGLRRQLVSDLVAVLREQPDIFSLDGEPVRIVEGQVERLDAQQVQLLVDCHVALFKQGRGGEEKPHNISKEDAGLVLTALCCGESGLRRLVAVQTLPYVTTAGQVVACAGWNRNTGIYLHLPPDNEPDIGNDTTDVPGALQTLTAPFKHYNPETADDAAALVAAVCTAVLRPVLSKAPMIGVDANIQGSGKTVFALSLGALTTGTPASPTPYANDGDSELRKRLFAGALVGQEFHCIDNVMGRFESGALSAVLTSGRISDRELGKSSMQERTTRALITFTSNNAHVGQDFIRRTLMVRFDGGANPAARRFDFDPATVALRDREQIAAAVCTLLAAYFAAGTPRMSETGIGSYEEWDLLCRQPVLWAAANGFADVLPWKLGDPGASMLRSAEVVDDIAAAKADLVQGLHILSEGKPFTGREMADWLQAANDDDGGVLTRTRDAFMELSPGRSAITAVAAGKKLSLLRGQHYSGFVLRDRRSSANSSVWQVMISG